MKNPDWFGQTKLENLILSVIYFYEKLRHKNTTLMKGDESISAIYTSKGIHYGSMKNLSNKIQFRPFFSF